MVGFDFHRPGHQFNRLASIFTVQVVSKTDRLRVKLLGLDQDGVAKRIQGIRGLAVGDMTSDIDRTKYEPHHQRWPSPQDQGVRCSALVGVHRKAKRRCDLLDIV